MRHVKAIVWFCAVGLATTAASVPVKAAGPTSTFDVDDEGWLIVNNGPETTPEYDSTGGNPGGYISSEDSVQGAAFWLAPSKFLGDMATAYNTGLSFDLKQSKTGRQTDAGDVLLTGGGLTVVFDTCYNPGSEWTHYGVPLHELAGWRRDSLGDPAATSAVATMPPPCLVNSSIHSFSSICGNLGKMPR